MKLKELFVLLFVPLCMFGQIDNKTKLPTFNPASPKSFEFLKYGEIPVSKYTGLPNISVPIYTINAKGLDIPINLSYHAGGFRVNEEAGWTGLGWSLNPGGAIVQVVNDFDDFGANPYRNRSMPNFEHIYNVMTENCSSCPPGSSIFGSCNGTLLRTDGEFNSQPKYLAGTPGYYYIPVDYDNNIKDSEPDIFKFNMLGYSGEFILDWQNETYMCLTDSRIKIVPSSNVVYGSFAPEMFSIIVPEGHKFVFRMMEATTINMNMTLNEIYPSSGGGLDMTGGCTSRSYQLISVVTNQGEQITYSYTLTPPIKNLPNISKSVIRYKNTVNSYPFPNFLSDNTTSFNYTQQSYAYINKIEFDGGTAIFSLSDRVDQVGSKKVDRIEIKKKLNNQTIKAINFSYSYFIGHNEGTNYDQYLNYGTGVAKTPEELAYRLKLNSVQEVGVNPYVFQYNTEALPKKTSLASDYWGFYNGVLSNQTPFVNIHAFGIEKNNPLFDLYDTNNKGSRLQYTKACVLEKITYPTKGYTTFNYELNSFSNEGTMKIPPFLPITTASAKVHSRSQDGLGRQNAVIVDEDNTVFSGSAYLSTFGCTSGDMSNGANENTYIKIEVFKKEFVDFVKNYGNFNNYGLMYVLASTGILNGTNQALRNQYLQNEFYITKNGNIQDQSFSNLNYSFNQGIVIFTSSGGCGTISTTNNSHAYLNLSYKKYSPFEAIADGAGLRIKEITSFSGNPSIKKTYNYYGGKKMSALHYYDSTQILNYDYLEYASNTDRHSSGEKLVLTSNSFIPISSNASGNIVGYDKVEEITVNTQPNTLTPNLGKITDYYINDPDSGILPNMNYGGIKEYKNGLVRLQEIYDSSNTIVQTSSNTYTTDVYACRFGMMQNLTSIRKSIKGQIIYYYYHYDIGVYPLKAYNIKLNKTVKAEYANSQSLITTTEYKYNSFNQQIYSKNTNSNNDIIESYIYYPKELFSVRTDASQMLNSNVISPVLRKETKINNELVQSEEFEYYKRLGANNNFTLPDIYSLSKSKGSKGGYILEDKILFNQYDSVGNVLDVSIPGGTRVSYIWGYNKKYVIAKIENMAYVDIPSSLVNTAISASDSSITGTESNLVSALNNLRTSLPNASVSTFTYEPLTGVKTITDSRGYITNYFYDSNGRLVQVKDVENNILTENTYHYKQ